MLIGPASDNLAGALGFHGDLSSAQGGRSAVAPPEPVMRQLDVDCRGIWLNPPKARPPHFVDEWTYVDEWGLMNRRPPGAFCFEVVNSPLAGEVSLGDLAKYPWPKPDDAGRTQGLREKAQHILQETGCAVVFTMGMPFVHICQYLRGFSDWYMDLAADQDLAAALMDRVLEVNLAIYDAALRELGDVVDVVALADDVGIQNGPMLSPETYRKLIKPRHRRVFDLIHARTDAKIMYHSCGSVYELLGDFVDIGVDALNPVQVSAAHMDTKTLKREWGQKLSFWGGIDTQKVLPSGTVDEVRDEVKRRIDDLAPGGGYILAAVHNIQPEVPAQNILSMINACKEYGCYGRQLS
ncbi:MAG: uroporphyrinogen decarboxylase family protein [Spirochaetia bacterium]|jgi:uroporphyrinogen decarboxylase